MYGYTLGFKVTAAKLQYTQHRIVNIITRSASIILDVTVIAVG